MDEYYSLIQKLPPPFCTELAGLNPQIAPMCRSCACAPTSRRCLPSRAG